MDTTTMSPPVSNFTNSDLVNTRIPMWLSVVCLLLAVVISVAAICGNALVLAAFIKYRSKVFTVFTVFALFLALTDLAIGLVTLPLYIWYDLYFQLTNSSTAREMFLEQEGLCFLENYFDFTPLILSLTTLCLMGLERCFALFAPSLHAHIRAWHAVVICGLVWVAIILFFSVDMIVNHDAILQAIHLECDHFSKDVQQFSLYYGAVVFVLCWLFYVAIFIKLCCNRTNANIESSRKVTKMTILILTAFTIAYLPVIIIAFVKDSLSSVLGTSLNNFFILVLYSNSAVNPFIYNKGSTVFHSAFRKLLCLKPSASQDEETVMSKTDIFSEKDQTTKF